MYTCKKVSYHYSPFILIKIWCILISFAYFTIIANFHFLSDIDQSLIVFETVIVSNSSIISCLLFFFFFFLADLRDKLSFPLAMLVYTWLANTSEEGNQERSATYKLSKSLSFCCNATRQVHLIFTWGNKENALHLCFRKQYSMSEQNKTKNKNKFILGVILCTFFSNP